MDEKKKDKEAFLNYIKQQESRVKEMNVKIKEKFKEENKMLKSINEEISKKNKKQYDTLKNQKEKLEEQKKEKAKENLEQKRIKVNAIKKIEDKEKIDKESEKNSSKTKKSSEETLKTLLSSQEKINYLREKDLIEQYKSCCEELIKQEKQYMEKIEEAKKLTKNARSGSAGRIRVFAPKNKNMKGKTKSIYKIGGKKEGPESIMMKYHKKLKENKKTGFKNRTTKSSYKAGGSNIIKSNKKGNEKGNNNIRKINTNEN